MKMLHLRNNEQEYLAEMLSCQVGFNCPVADQYKEEPGDLKGRKENLVFSTTLASISYINKGLFLGLIYEKAVVAIIFLSVPELCLTNNRKCRCRALSWP